ncbi:MAG: hypothetical protein QNJ68_03570 [Microcoleaceae cyanobacterium MO_207.B10]|nr:hypothetical protein [Microcoleaceae cyanobacterium MO_207.B10]
MLFEEPFCTHFGVESDPKYNSPESELKEFFLRQNLIFDLLEGKEHADTVLDCLDEQGIDPFYYLENLCESVDFIIENNIEITNAGLWVPR